jgi:hypothetical protein
MLKKRLYRNDILPAPGMIKLRRDTGKVPPGNRMDGLENDLIADQEKEQPQDAQDANPVDTSSAAKDNPSAFFIDAKVRK